MLWRASPVCSSVACSRASAICASAPSCLAPIKYVRVYALDALDAPFWGLLDSSNIFVFQKQNSSLPSKENGREVLWVGERASWLTCEQRVWARLAMSHACFIVARTPWNAQLCAFRAGRHFSERAYMPEPVRNCRAKLSRVRPRRSLFNPTHPSCR